RPGLTPIEPTDDEQQNRGGPRADAPLAPRADRETLEIRQPEREDRSPPGEEQQDKGQASGFREAVLDPDDRQREYQRVIAGAPRGDRQAEQLCPAAGLNGFAAVRDGARELAERAVGVEGQGRG